MKHGFSLVELSIVLVILGLLTGGILAGQSLIRAAEIRSVTADIQRIMTAQHTFRDRYMALPGDMRNATTFWGAQDGGDGLGNDCYTSVSTTSATCNGNGDGAFNSTSTYGNELFRYWQHLSNAGLIEGTYTGVNTGTNYYGSTVGLNIPAGKISQTGFGVVVSYTTTGDAGTFAGQYLATTLLFGRSNDASNYPVGSVLKPAELWNIDTKIDDGKPGIGKIVARGWQTCTLATASTEINADYNLTNDSLACAVYIKF